MTTIPSANTYETISISASPTLLNVNMTNVTKLTSTNFLMWSRQLALMDKALPHEDQIDCIVDGLPEEYKFIIDQIQGRETPPAVPEVHERLLNHEVRLQIASSAPPPATFPITANVAQTATPRFNNNNYRQPRYDMLNRYNSKNSPTWQQQQNFSPRPTQRESRGYQGKCKLCGVFGHSAQRCSRLQNVGHSFSTPWQPRANLAASSSYNPNNWILDSGATHHLTSDLQNLSLHHPYNGGEEVTIADGSGLTISYTGEGSQHGGPIAPRQFQHHIGLMHLQRRFILSTGCQLR
ncbi:hypothetical protein AALP_AA5G273100 [Arabis alpina]|uniref:CCHC-type domain-containing protein n=1 Tax=Arabis alpina TaxID=50452 RepID=A0A087GZP7_ARAAL|nr:hypothetical protein AALP_AA5G273100 [Arabis alpina]